MAKVAFNFENQRSTFNPSSSRPGLLTSLSDTKSGLTISLRRGASSFDIVSNTGTQQKPSVFGQRSLDPFVSPNDPTPFTVDFSRGVYSVSVAMGDYGQDDNDTLSLRAYSGQNASGTLLALRTDTLPSNGDRFAFKVLTVSSSTPIRSITMQGGTSSFRNSVFYDNLEVTTTPTSPPASPRFLATTGARIGSIDPLTGTYVELGNSGVTFTDLASSRNNLFGITFDSLYRVNPSTGASTLVGRLGVSGMNALGLSSSGQLYGASGSNFYRIDKTTGRASLIASIPSFNSSGDLVYDANSSRFFATSRSGTTDELFSIGTDGDARRVGATGFRDVFGLFFDRGTLYGYTNDRKQIRINTSTGTGIFDRIVTGTSEEIYGAT
jgi:hypothetical protein